MNGHNAKILVTGGAGFIGSHLVRMLVERGMSVRVLDLPTAPTTHLPLDRIELATGDIRDRDAVERAVRGCREVYHLAGNPNLWVQQRGLFRQVNYVGTINVIEAALSAGVRRVLHTSTESILTAPSKPAPSPRSSTSPTRTRSALTAARSTSPSGMRYGWDAQERPWSWSIQRCRSDPAISASRRPRA